MCYFNFCVFFVCFRPWLPVFWRMLVFCCLLKAQFKFTFSTKSAVNWNLFGMHEAVFSLMHSESCFSLIDWFGKRLMIQADCPPPDSFLIYTPHPHPTRSAPARSKHCAQWSELRQSELENLLIPVGPWGIASSCPLHHYPPAMPHLITRSRPEWFRAEGSLPAAGFHTSLPVSLLGVKRGRRCHPLGYQGW